MANLNAPFGLKPINLDGTTWSGQGRLVYIPSGQGNIFIGDPLIRWAPPTLSASPPWASPPLAPPTASSARSWASPMARRPAATPPTPFCSPVRSIIVSGVAGYGLICDDPGGGLHHPGRLRGRRDRGHHRRLCQRQPDRGFGRFDRHRAFELDAGQLHRRHRQCHLPGQGPGPDPASTTPSATTPAGPFQLNLSALAQNTAGFCRYRRRLLDHGNHRRRYHYRRTPKALWPGIKAWFGRQYAEHAEQYPLCFDVVTSDKAYEEEVEISGFGVLREKDQGSATTFDSEVQGLIARYTHRLFERVHRDVRELRDDLYEIVSSAAPPPRFRRSPDRRNRGRQRLQQRLQRFLYGRRRRCLVRFDPPEHFGQPVQRAGRVGRHLGIGNRRPGGADHAGHGLPRQQDQPDPAVLHIAPAQIFDANRILHSILQNNTANNAINVIKAMGLFPKGIVTNNYFTSAVNWFIRTDCPTACSSCGATSPSSTPTTSSTPRTPRPCCTCASALIGPTGADFMDVSACNPVSPIELVQLDC